MCLTPYQSLVYFGQVCSPQEAAARQQLALEVNFRMHMHVAPLDLQLQTCAYMNI